MLFTTTYYKTTSYEELIPIAEIDLSPAMESKLDAVMPDWNQAKKYDVRYYSTVGGLDQDRLSSILTGILHGHELPAVTLAKKQGYYRITNGRHRIVASILNGYTHIPAYIEG